MAERPVDALHAAVDALAVRTMRRRGVTVHTLDAPTGPLRVFDAPGTGDLGPVVLIHGLSAEAVDWSPVLHRLRRHVSRVIVPDLPGHGLSALPPGPVQAHALVDAVVHALDTLVPDGAVLVGNSLGGLTAIRVAQGWSAPVPGLALISPGGAPMSEADFQAFLTTFDPHVPGNALAFVDRLLAKPPAYKPVWAWILKRRLTRPDVVRFIRAAKASDLLDADALRALPLPILCLWGQQDTLLPDSHRAFFRDNLPEHALFEEPDGLGHSPYLDDPEGVTARLAAWMRTLP